LPIVVASIRPFLAMNCCSVALTSVIELPPGPDTKLHDVLCDVVQAQVSMMPQDCQSRPAGRRSPIPHPKFIQRPRLGPRDIATPESVEFRRDYRLAGVLPRGEFWPRAGTPKRVNLAVLSLAEEFLLLEIASVRYGPLQAS
jgi:hypothetical protein